MELLIDPIVIDGELPFKKRIGGECDKHECSEYYNSNNWADLLVIIFILIVVIIAIWKFTFFNSAKVKDVER